MSTGSADQPAKRPARKRDAVKTQQEIVYAAGQRFATAGYSRVTLHQIAEDVGITPALIVRYFGSKKALFEAVSSDYAGYSPVLSEDSDDGHTLADRLAKFIVNYWQDENARWTVMSLIRSLDVEGVPELFQRELTRRAFTPWSARITGDDADVRRRMLVGLMMGFGLFGVGVLIDPEPEKLSGEEAANMERYLSKMIAICLDAEPTTG